MGKEYAILRFNKCTTMKQLVDAYNHNMRIYNVTNADPTRRDLNLEPVDLNGKTYVDACEEAIMAMKICGANPQTIRKDAVKGVELVLRYSHEADSHISQEEWVEANIKWLREQFNPPDRKIHYTDKDGNIQEREIDNLVSVVVHNDEGVPHIHAMIIPIDDRGHLNSNYYFGGRGKLIEMQNSYAKAMEPFGLERGEYKSIATPEKVSRYLTEITKATDAKLPEPEKGETVEEYYERANHEFQNVKIHHRDEIVKQKQEHVRATSEMLKSFEHSHEDAWENKKAMRKLKRIYDMDNIGDKEIEEIKKREDERKDMEAAITNIKNEETKEEIRRLMEEERRRREKEEKEKKRKKSQNVGR